MTAAACFADADSMTGRNYVWDFADGSRELSSLLGGKGANIAEMTRLLGADLVPAGFTVTTAACTAYLESGNQQPEGLESEVTAALNRLEEQTGRQLGDPNNPLLLSVRSGARRSMPGMMDTVLNLGLNDRSVEGLAAVTGNERFAWDCYRRFVQMFSNVVGGVSSEQLEAEIDIVKQQQQVALDSDLSPDALRDLTGRFLAIYRSTAGEQFPQLPGEQLRLAIEAVFRSWNGERAIKYRRLNRIPDDWGTAANIQQMVFGNLGDDSGSGVAFSRDEVTGEPQPSGDFLANAQGEDVVSGVRNTRPLAELAEWLPAANSQLLEILKTLEGHYGDMQDTEFTIENQRLYMLQTRTAKRPAQASIQFACDAVDEELLSEEQALLTIGAAELEALLHPRLARPLTEAEVFARGVAASPGAAAGEIVFTAPDAVEAAAAGRDVILVRRHTEADDIAGFHAARGILTSTGGKASHAALVARGMGRPCVCGAAMLEVNAQLGELRVAGSEQVLRAGDRITLDGSGGLVSTSEIPLSEPGLDQRFERVLGWADRNRRLGVRANADTPDDASRARRLGAEGIGLCRTEHMFMAADRQPLMRAMILAEDLVDREAALAKLLPLQQNDFEGLFAEMQGLPVTIRLLDPPLHEFLHDPAMIERSLAEAATEAERNSLQIELERTVALQEANPMLGTRGVRLGLVHPEIYAMQLLAICRALKAASGRGEPTKVEVMIPLVGYEQELRIARQQAVEIAASERLEVGRDFSVGTMIELPRACVVADLIARDADFFSFGTNDLTQTTLGFSRDDVEGTILDRYIELRVLDRSPFETLDTPGVGALVSLAAERGRSTNPQLKLGICGEHGGDPDSISFFDSIDLDYVSCSPFRVPIARIAAAQAAIKSADGRDAA